MSEKRHGRKSEVGTDKKRSKSPVRVNIPYHMRVYDDMYPLNRAAESVWSKEWCLKSNNPGLCV